MYVLPVKVWPERLFDNAHEQIVLNRSDPLDFLSNFLSAAQPPTQILPKAHAKSGACLLERQ